MVKTNSANQIQENDLVLVWFNEKEVSYLTQVSQGKQLSIHCGKPLKVEEWIGLNYGSSVKCDHAFGYLLRPTTDDLMMKAARESGIIYPKDAATLIMRTGIGSGAKVLEIGTGSGSLTLALASAVRPDGHVHTFDRRSDLPKNAEKNLSRANLLEYVTFHQRSAGEPFAWEQFFDVVILDIPTPWEEVEPVKAALKGGGHVVSLNPCYNQVERMAEALRAHGFIRVDCLEILERPILAREGKTRPVQRMVSHTEFLLFGTKITPPG